MFTWPEVDRLRFKSYFRFNTDFPLTEIFICERDLTSARCRRSKGSSATVLQYRISNAYQARMKFSQVVAIKTIGRTRDMKVANDEALAMEGLSHPHISAFLGTFNYNFTDYIITYPVGCCDLGDFMACISLKLEDKVAPPISMPGATPEEIRIVEEYSWPFEEDLKVQFERLQSYFLCLSGALAYLHESNVRHRDIKPENIIIDDSGKVILVDFGIATKFENAQDMRTQSELFGQTDKYMPPERAKRQAREPRSDVYCLGCVFLEMMSLLFGQTIEVCKSKTSHVLRRSRDRNYNYYANLEAVYEYLKELKQSPEFYGPCEEQRVRDAVNAVKMMLAVDAEKRPFARELPQQFDFAKDHCADCHPTHKRPLNFPTHREKRYADGKTKRNEFTELENRIDEHDLAEAARLVETRAGITGGGDDESSESEDADVQLKQATEQAVLSAARRNSILKGVTIARSAFGKSGRRTSQASVHFAESVTTHSEGRPGSPPPVRHEPLRPGPMSPRSFTRASAHPLAVNVPIEDKITPIISEQVPEPADEHVPRASDEQHQIPNLMEEEQSISPTSHAHSAASYDELEPTVNSQQEEQLKHPLSLRKTSSHVDLPREVYALSLKSKRRIPEKVGSRSMEGWFMHIHI